MNRRAVSGIVLTLMLICLLTMSFCVQPAESESIPLTVIGPWSGKEEDAFMPVLNEFERRTGINVRYRIFRAEDLATTLPSQFDAGKTPGDVIFMWPWYIREAGQQGYVVDVSVLIDEADFRPGVLDEVKIGDTFYGASYTGKGKPGFWYRRSFFETNGLTPPRSWDEFMVLLDDISAIPGIMNSIVSGDGVGWPLSDMVEQFLITFGGSQLQRDLITGAVAWNSSQVRTIFADKVVPLLEARHFSEPIEWTTAVDLWWDGDYGLYFMGSWITTMVDDPEDLGVFMLPQAEGLVFAADYFFIPEYTSYPDEAELLLQFLASAEAQETQVAQGGHIATNIHVSLDAYPPVDRRVAEVMEGMEVLPDLDDTIGGEFQTTFWDQLKLLWVDPTILDDVLSTLQEVAPKPQRRLLGTGWGRMRVAPRVWVRGLAELYSRGEYQIKLVINYQGEDWTRIWKVVCHKEYGDHEVYLCHSLEHGFLIVGLHRRRWTFWYAMGRHTVALGFARQGKLGLVPV